jgi:hypothetical protein
MRRSVRAIPPTAGIYAAFHGSAIGATSLGVIFGALDAMSRVLLAVGAAPLLAAGSLTWAATLSFYRFVLPPLPVPWLPPPAVCNCQTQRLLVRHPHADAAGDAAARSLRSSATACCFIASP